MYYITESLECPHTFTRFGVGNRKKLSISPKKGWEKG